MGEVGADGDGGGGAEMGRIKGDADAVIDGEDQGLVPLPPVLDDGYIGGRLGSHHQDP